MNDYGILLDVTLPITNPRRTGVGSKPTLDCEMPVSNYLNNGTLIHRNLQNMFYRNQHKSLQESRPTLRNFPWKYQT